MGSQPKGISASRAAAILGLGEYEGQTPFTVWQLICEERRPGFNAERGYVMPAPPDNAAIRFGTAFEDSIVELASAKAGKKIWDRERLFVASSELDFVTCHIDGIYGGPNESAYPETLHEGKTTNLWTFRELWGDPGTDRVPQSYQCQGQHQMLCTVAQEDLFSVLVFPRRPDEWEKEGWLPFQDTRNDSIPHWRMRQIEAEKVIKETSPMFWADALAEMGMFYQYPVHAKPELQKEMVERYQHFWHTYVLPEAEPPIDCYPDMLRAFPAPVGTIVLTEQEAAWITERKMITEEIGDSSPLAKRKRELARLTLDSVRSRRGCAVIDEESQDKVVFVDSAGKKLGQYDGKTFR
jgi:predicted phage-related endonuclease